MMRIDDAESIRQLAYDIWQREGCPSGREHEHWAEANRVFAADRPEEPPKAVDRSPVWNAAEAERHEIEAMRCALWTPEDYSLELFGKGASFERLGEPSQAAATRPNSGDAGSAHRRFTRKAGMMPRYEADPRSHRTDHPA